MNWRRTILQCIAPTAATVVFGFFALNVVRPGAAERPWDPFIPWLSLGFSLIVLWLLMSVVCAGVRLSALRLHWAPRWMAYLALTCLALAVPLVWIALSYAVSTICNEGCDVGPNLDGFYMMFHSAMWLNHSWWPFIAPLTVIVASWMAYLERSSTVGKRWSS